MSRTSLHHEQFLKKRRAQKSFKFQVGAFVTLLLLGIFVYVFHIQKFRISKVELTGSVILTDPEVEKKTIEYLAGSYFFLFPKNNALLYPRASLQDYLKENLKRIDTVDVHLKDSQTLAVNITERKGVSLWCAGKDMATSTAKTLDKCYFMDDQGTIFADAPDFSGDAYFKYYGLVEDENPIGKMYIASSTEFSDLTEFIETTRKLSFHPLYLVGKSAGLPAQVGQFTLALSGGGEIYFDTKEPLSKTSQNFEALLHTPALSAVSPDKLPLDYIDLRFGNKLYYKLKGK